MKRDPLAYSVIEFAVCGRTLKLGLKSLVSLLNEDTSTYSHEQECTSDHCDDKNWVIRRSISGRKGLERLGLVDHPVLTIEAKSRVGVFKAHVVSTEESISQEISCLIGVVLSVDKELTNILLGYNT